MKKFSLLIMIVFLLPVLTSCWDTRLLKEHSLILAIGYDLNEDKTISKTVTFPSEAMNNAPQEKGTSESDVITTVGNTVGDSDIELERYLAQKFDRSKSRVLLIGEELAKYGMFPTLDSMYRDLRGPLNASIAIVRERAEEGLKVENNQSLFTSEFYFNLIKSAEESGIIKEENIQSICPVLLSERRDIALPLINVQNKNDTRIEGLALFSEDKMTGELNTEQSIMLLILINEIVKKVKVNLRINDDAKKHEENYVTFAIRKEKRKFNVYEENDRIKATVGIYLRIEIEEFPEDHLFEREKINQLEKRITKRLTEVAEETIEAIQQANTDALGIGEQVKARYNSTWEKINWREVYPEIPIDVSFDVDIVQHGVIN